MPGFVPVVYAGGAPVLSSSGAQRVACAHLAEWLAVYDALQVARGRGHVTFYQTMGGADASAGTHTCGSAWDMAWTGNAAILDAREMGAAVWPRLRRLGWVGGEHVHGLIRCGDNGCNDYQFAAYLLGYNGLGQSGYGAGDPLPQPTTRRTWREGIVWAKAEIARLNGTASQEDDMPRLLLDTSGTGWLITDRGVATVGSTADAKILRRILDAGQYLAGTEDRVLPGEVEIYRQYVARANGPQQTVTVTGNVDPAIVTKAVEDGITKALNEIAWTTRKA